MALGLVSLALYSEQEGHNGYFPEADRYQGCCISHPDPVHGIREVGIR